jgi:hypothetical protein
MAYEQEKYRTGGGFGGGAFGGGQSGGGIQLRSPGRYSQATAGMSNIRSDIQGFLNQNPARQAPPTMQGMVHTPPQTGFMPQMPNPGFGYSGSKESYVGQRDRQNALGALPPPDNMPSPRAPTSTEVTAAKEQAATPEVTPSEREIQPGVFRQGNSYYGKGTSVAPGTTIEAGGAQLGPGGFVGSTSGQGAFGRSPAEQTAIENRVGEIQRATDFIRGMRNIPSELDRFKAQAQQRISLDQGIGGFLNQASQRNYARDRVTELEEGSKDQAKLALEAQQQGFDNALATQNAAKGAFKTTTIVGPDGVEIPLTTNTATGETSLGEAPKRQLSETEARSQFNQLADQEWSSKGGVFTDERDVFKVNGKGVSREEWIEAQVRKATGGGEQAPQKRTIAQDKNGNKIEWDGKDWVPVK